MPLLHSNNFSGWMAALKEANDEVKIVPRILFDGWTKSDYLELFTDLDHMNSLGSVLKQQLQVSMPRSWGFDQFCLVFHLVLRV